MPEFEVLPVFPSVVSATKIVEDISALWNLSDSIEYNLSDADDTQSVYASKNLHLLETLPDIKKIILDYFYSFKNTVLKLDTTNFEITTSWMTKTEPNGFCQYHRHRNSYYSGVLYSSKTNSIDSGNLMFTDDGIKQDSMLINTPSEWNILNSNRIVIEPDANLMIFFPSALRHRISRYTGTENRYSLAFNLFPVGNLGKGDSSIKLELIN
jgi:uncharacterized protein (TIGR02466 family)